MTFAKGSSSRLPRKNLLPFAGKPLVEWTLIAMNASRYLTDRYIVTESDEIAGLAEKHGFQILWQEESSAATAGHYGAPVCEALFFDTVHKYHDFEPFVTLLPTSPCRRPEDIDRAVEKYLRTVAENPGRSVGVASLVRRKDLQLMEEADGSVRTIMFENHGKFLVTNGSVGVRSVGFARRQAEELPKILEAFRAGTHYAGFAKDPDIVTFIEDEVWQQWDIDSRADFELCERLFVANGLGESAFRRYRAKEVD